MIAVVFKYSKCLSEKGKLGRFTIAELCIFVGWA
jgi:hypothetical protein